MAAPTSTTAHATATRRLTFLALLSAAAAVVLVVVAAQGGGDGESDDYEWILGLGVILAPLVCAAATRSVAASTLLRPVGGVATPLCALASAVHVALAVEGQGMLGWAYGAPAIATPLLLLAAVVRGPDRRPDGRSDPFGPAFSVAEPGWSENLDRPPLDVVTPLRDARNHAMKSALAWLAVLGILAVVGVPLFRLLGWPQVVARLEGQVIDVRPVDGNIAVTFRAQDRDRTVRWTHVSEESNLAVGDRRVVFLGENERMYFNQQFGLTGIPMFMPAFAVATFGVFAVRRVWGLAIAWWDVHNTQDAPRLGYAAVIDDPSPRAWRPLLAVWDDDPTTQPRLAKPDAVYRADDETGEDLQSPASDVVVRRAWIDTGVWHRSKPRWVGFDDGVAVPHRRSLLGRWYIRVVTRRAQVVRVAELNHGPPAPHMQSPQPGRPDRHRMAGMIAWRLLAIVFGVAAAYLYVNDGDPARIEPHLALESVDEGPNGLIRA